MTHPAAFSLTILTLTVLTAPTTFAQLQDLEEGKDHPMVSRYAGSIILAYDAREFDEFVLPLGPITRQDTPSGIEVEPTKSERIEGKTTRILYVAPANRSPLEVIRNYEQELRKAGFQTLYFCAGDECGGEDGWLSEYYLYSSDRELSDAPPGASGVKGQISEYAFSFPRGQRYLAGKLTRPEGDVYASVYVATETFDHFAETKDHVLVLLDVIETVPMETGMVSVDAATMAKDLAAEGHVALYINFDFDKADIKAESQPIIDEIVKLLQDNPNLSLVIEGHTDNVGAPEYNKQLSEARARSVVAALTARGIEAARLQAVGLGQEKPIADNSTDEGRARNRRVELVER